MQESHNQALLPPDARIVIVGAGQAGGWAARTLRNEGFTGSITLVGDEPWPPHERPPLSKRVLQGSAAPESTHLFPDADWAALDIAWMPGRLALALDRQTRTLTLDDGTVVSWDRLILCTGGRSRKLMPPGLDENCESLRSIDDALRLRARLQSARRLLVVGGGWIGLEVAATARELGLEVTLVEAAGRLCARSLPHDISDWLLQLHLRHGVRVMLQTEMTSACRQADGSVGVVLSSAQQTRSTLAVDLIVAGIGMIPNDDMARLAGLECDAGIVVDTACRTSVAGIFAAGDVAVSPNSWMGRSGRLESWQNAQEQGIAAALSAIGRPVIHDPLPWFWSDQFGVNLQIQGVVCDADQVITRRGAGTVDPSAGAIHFYLRAGRLLGVIGFNAAKDVRASRKLIATGASPDPAALADASLALNKLA